MADLTFDDWLAALASLARRDGAGEYIAEAGADAWRESYDDGATPGEVWETERYYGAQDLG